MLIMALLIHPLEFFTTCSDKYGNIIAMQGFESACETDVNRQATVYGTVRGDPEMAINNYRNIQRFLSQFFEGVITACAGTLS